MPEFWQFPTVSMGLGPMMAIYQARFMRYLEHRGIIATQDRKVWCFVGDGEMDEPESMGAITMPRPREARQSHLRHQLQPAAARRSGARQRQDHPGARGRVQGAGWNVIKVIWGYRWDPFSHATTKDCCARRWQECVDGEFQNFKAKDGAYTREHFFGQYPELKAIVANMSDEDIWHLSRGGHDARQGVRGIPRGRESQRPSDRDPREDGQGLRHGRGRRSAEHHAPEEEARRRRPEAVPRPLPPAGHRRADPRPRVLQAVRRQRGDEIPQDAAREARRLFTDAPHAASSRSRFRRSTSSRASSSRAATASSRPRWRSSGS